MLAKDLFKKPKNILEATYDKYFSPNKTEPPSIPQDLCVRCNKCREVIILSDLQENYHICPKCGYHFRMNARQRLNYLCDNDSFTEMFEELKSENVIEFPGYEQKLENARLASKENEAVICGYARICRNDVCIFIMEPNFMMGSMGCIVGEKITRLFEYAEKNNLPVIGFSVSGGARMQEGMFSLMQMAKTSGAVKRHGDSGNLFISVLTDPTMGGVTASFAMEGDIIISEPNALIGFAGPRVIEQTIRQKLPQGFQRAEFLLEKGFLDDIVDRRKQKRYIARLLVYHKKSASLIQNRG